MKYLYKSSAVPRVARETARGTCVTSYREMAGDTTHGSHVITPVSIVAVSLTHAAHRRHVIEAFLVLLIRNRICTRLTYTIEISLD